MNLMAGPVIEVILGELFFGGINGFNAFFPGQILDNPVIPPIVITSFSQEGVDLLLETEINFLDRDHH